MSNNLDPCIPVSRIPEKTVPNTSVNDPDSLDVPPQE